MSGSDSNGYQGGNPPYLPDNNPDRSANDGQADAYSDPNAREQSEGFRPSLCGFLTDLGETIIDVADHINRADQSLVDFVEHVADFVKNPTDPTHLTHAFQDLHQATEHTRQAYNSSKAFVQRNKEFIKDTVATAFEVGIQIAIAFSPLDWVVDGVSLALGYDIFTGYELSDFEKGAIIFGLLTAGIGDDILQMGARASRYVDGLGEGAEFAAKHAEELGDAARFATKHSDELADAVTWSARHGDDLSEARLAQRLDNDASHSLGNGRFDPNYKPRQATPSQEEIYDKLTQSETGQQILDQVDEIGEHPKIKFTNDGFNKPSAAASYLPGEENAIIIRPELQDLPEEALLATVAHELAHRTHRKLTGSINSEIFAHFVEAQVLRELDGVEVIRKLNLSNLTDGQRKFISSQVQISQIRTVEEMEKYVRPLYDRLPDYSITRIEDYQNAINQIYRQREEYNLPKAMTDTEALYKERLEFWESLKE